MTKSNQHALQNKRKVAKRISTPARGITATYSNTDMSQFVGMVGSTKTVRLIGVFDIADRQRLEIKKNNIKKNSK